MRIETLMAGHTQNTRSSLQGGAIIHVGPLTSIEAMIARSGARYLVTAINRQMMPTTPAPIEPQKHLRLGFNDIVEPAFGMTPPSATHVRSLIEFAKVWNHDGPLVIHCLAGISRSTASAFIVMCTLNPDCSEETIATLLRDASPTAAPNQRLIQLADEALGREGRMIHAIDALSPPEIRDCATPFSLPSLVQVAPGG